MKKLYLLLALVVITLASCSNDKVEDSGEFDVTVYSIRDIYFIKKHAFYPDPTIYYLTSESGRVYETFDTKNDAVKAAFMLITYDTLESDCYDLKIY